MDRPESPVAETPRPSVTGVTPANFSSSLIRRDTSSSDISGPYLPIPEGRWIVPFHGNCPRCHHHHDAARMKIKITQDASRFSRIDCERCNERWIAIGGHNATSTSLASVTSTEPDAIEEGVRFSLIDVVKMAMEQAAHPLDTLPEQPIPESSRQVPLETSASGPSYVSERSSISPTAATRTSSLSSTESHQSPQHPEPVRPPVLEHAFVATEGSRPRIMLNKLRNKLTSRFPWLHRHSLKQFIAAPTPSKMFIMQSKKLPVIPPPTSDQHFVSPEEQPPVQRTRTYAAAPLGPDVAVSESDSVRPSQRLVEVIAFIAGLDKSVLETKSEQERIEWMREVYTQFKRNRRQRASVSIAAIVHTGIQCDRPVPYDRRSAELLGAGTHIMGIENIDYPERTLSISEIDTESQTRRGDTTAAIFLQQSRQQLQQAHRGSGPQRPQSMPSPPRSSPPPAYQNLRSSMHAHVQSRPESTSSMYGQVSPRWSQTSATLIGSTLDLQETLSD